MNDLDLIKSETTKTDKIKCLTDVKFLNETENVLCRRIKKGLHDGWIVTMCLTMIKIQML